jgi:formiminotetrahydrofolate cyclodeaminase
MTTYATYALIDLLDAISSSDPVPGGGSAAALAGAAGTALLMMVASLPKTRTSAPEEFSDLAEAASRLRSLRDTFVDLIDRDSAAYLAVVSARRLPKATDDERATRREALDLAIRGATEAPLDTMRACRQALADARLVATHGHVAAGSDAYVGVELLVAALRGAARNVDENVSGVKDQSWSNQVRTERRRLEDDALADAAGARARLSP